MFGQEYEYIKEYKPFEIQSQIKEKSIKDDIERLIEKSLNYLYENRSNFEEKFNDKCPNHSNEKVKDFCLDCVEYLCDKCKEGKKFHFKHNIVNKDDYIKTIKENIGKLPILNDFLEE